MIIELAWDRKTNSEHSPDNTQQQIGCYQFYNRVLRDRNDLLKYSGALLCYHHLNILLALRVYRTIGI